MQGPADSEEACQDADAQDDGQQDTLVEGEDGHASGEVFLSGVRPRLQPDQDGVGQVRVLEERGEGRSGNPVQCGLRAEVRLQPRPVISDRLVGFTVPSNMPRPRAVSRNRPSRYCTSRIARFTYASGSMQNG